MITPEPTANEHERQAALERSGLLDSGEEERFDRYTRIATNLFEVPIALVTLLDRDRQWFKSRRGLDIQETPRDVSFCDHTIRHSGVFVVENALTDRRFCDNPLVTGDPGIVFYAGTALHSSDGYCLGTLCIIDRSPRKLSATEWSLLKDLASCVEREITSQSEARIHHVLEQSERRARAAIEGTRVGTWEWNIETGDMEVNQRWREICGYDTDNPMNTDTWQGMIHPDDLKNTLHLLDSHIAGISDQYDSQYRIRHQDGHWIWVHSCGRIFEWSRDGQPRIMYGTTADITDIKNNLERIRYQNEALSILNDLALDPETNDDERIRKALRLGAGYLRLPLAIVSEVTGDVYTVLWFEAPEDSGLKEGLSFPLADTYCSIIVEKKDSLAISHMAKSPYRAQPCYELFGLESYLAAPIHVQNQLFGTLNFSSPSPRPEGFSDTEITFVTLLARWIAGVIERRTSMQTLTKLVQQTPGMLYQYRLWPDGSSAFPFCSQGITEIYGLSEEEVRDDATPCFSRIHPEDLPMLELSIASSALDLSVWNHQYRVAPQKEQWRWVEGRATPEELADKSIMWHGYITDIDEKKRTQLALQESEDELRRLFEQSPIGIALTDFLTTEFLDANDVFVKSSGYTREELLEICLGQLREGGFSDIRSQALTEISETGRYGPYEQNIVRKDGSMYPARIQGWRIINSAGRPLVWSLVEDISEQKKVERMKNEFISTVSHELRTPLTSIAGSLGLIAGEALGPLPEQVKNLIAIAANNSDQLKYLIDDLLDMEKLVSGTMALTLAPHRISPILRDAIDRLHTFAEDRHIRIRFDDRHPRLRAIIDGQRLGQAFTNLLSNAIKFSPDNSEVLVTTDLHDGFFRIQVCDQGPGIPAGFRSRIFQKFAQADSSDTRGRRGTGLGLAITREIMTQMGGQVDFESVEGQGASFWLEIPSGQD